MNNSNDTVCVPDFLTSFNKRHVPPASFEFKRALDQLHSDEQCESILADNTLPQLTVHSLTSKPSVMGKIESRSLSQEKCEKPIFPVTNGYCNSKTVESRYNRTQGKPPPGVCNGKYKDGYNESVYSKEKTKTKKLITSRSPKTIEQHQAIMYAEIKDTSFYENDFRRRSMSESHAQLRKQILERRQRIINEQEGSDDIQHRVKWADNLGDSLTSELRRRSYSHGATGLPSRPILKKITNDLTTDTGALPVDTRYL